MSSPGNPQLVTALQQGAAAAAKGQFPAAEHHYRRARTLAPTDSFIAIALGHVLRHQQRSLEAKAQFSAAFQLNPALADAHYGLGLSCQDMMDMAGAEAAYRGALARDPAFLPAMLGLATVFNSTGRPDEALAVLAKVTTADARLGAAIEQARGAAELTKENAQAALAHFDRALALAPGHPEATHSRAVTLQYVGAKEEALAGLRKVVRDYPGNMAAHHDLNQLLYRMRRDDEFLRSYDEAAARYPGAPQFPLAKAALLVRVERPDEALEIYDRLLKQAPGQPIVLQGRAMAQLNLARVDEAIASYEEGLKAAPRDLNMLTGVAAAYLVGRAPKKAEDAALRALEIAPEDQTALALLGTAWRLQDDAREHDLHRYDTFIQVFDLEPPPGFSSMAAFCRELDGWLDSQHDDAREHVDQTLRGGTQTIGDLLRPGRHPLIDALGPRIEAAVREYLSRLPQDARHPFLRRRGRDFHFSGSWSSRLKDRGFHANHVHPAGWISSAFYIAVPEVVNDAATKEGWIKFGEPNRDVGLTDPVRRAVQPKVGRLVLFPSYTWHGTVPFHAPQDRTTIAFDAVPAR